MHHLILHRPFLILPSMFFPASGLFQIPMDLSRSLCLPWAGRASPPSICISWNMRALASCPHIFPIRRIWFGFLWNFAFVTTSFNSCTSRARLAPSALMPGIVGEDTPEAASANCSNPPSPLALGREKPPAYLGSLLGFPLRLALDSLEDRHSSDA